MSEESDKEKLVEGTLLSHLLELRERLMRAVIAVVVLFIPAAFYSNPIFDFLAKPLSAQLPKGSSLIATGVMTTFTTPLKLSFMVALFAAMPYVLYQLWGFVAPGLYRHEKRFAVPLLVSSIVLFYVGVAFAYPEMRHQSLPTAKGFGLMLIASLISMRQSTPITSAPVCPA